MRQKFKPITIAIEGYEQVQSLTAELKPRLTSAHVTGINLMLEGCAKAGVPLVVLFFPHQIEMNTPYLPNGSPDLDENGIPDGQTPNPDEREGRGGLVQ